MPTLRRRIARQLRHTADRIDPTSGPRATGHVFSYATAHPGGKGGMVITPNAAISANGCRLWYMLEDYDRAFDPLPAKSEHAPIRLNMMEPVIHC